jgi:cytochrome c2
MPECRAIAIVISLLLSGCDQPLPGPEVQGGDAERGRAALRKYECGVCHLIPGVPGAKGRVGPALHAYSRRIYIAGRFPNEPDTLTRWLLDPPALAPDTAMPRIPMTQKTAVDIAAYLYSLE